MIYSVFDWNSGLYHYFEGPGEGLGVRPKGKDINDPGGRGHKIEELLPVVPAGSQPVGRGDVARGRIAMLTDDLRSAMANVGGQGDEAVRRFVGLDHNTDTGSLINGYGAADDVSWWPTFSTCEEAYPSTAGFGAAPAPAPTGNPLVDSPWMTLALWAASVYGLYWLATEAGRYVAGRR